MADATQWGRVAEDGTVYIRTPDGERAVGSWQAGDPEAGLAHYARRYDDLATEVSLLEARLASGAGHPSQTVTSLHRLRESLDTAAVVGDIEALRSRVDAALARAKAKQAEEQVARASAAAAVVDTRRALAEEAERVAQSSEWKASGDRLRAIVEEWKALPPGTKPAESELWHRISAARRAFDKRRDAHFTALESQREVSKERKEALIREAERLADSTEWTPTAARFKELMAEWKAAGRAARGVDDELWARFKGAQDAFFTKRSAHYAERDAETAGNVAAREALLAEAEALEPDRDLAGARARLADILERWEKAERVPREVEARLDARLATVERRLREVDDTHRVAERAAPPNPFVVRLKESLEQLEKRAARARAAGDERAAAAADAEAATKREWLAQAEQSLS